MSHYRKHVRKQLSEDYPEPKENENIVVVSDTKNGGNILEVEYPNGKKILCFFPSKYKGLVYLKKGQYVIITENTETQNKGKIVGCVEHILFKEQVKHLKEKNLWQKKKFFFFCFFFT